jgi:hypothetical protein
MAVGTAQWKGSPSDLLPPRGLDPVSDRPQIPGMSTAPSGPTDGERVWRSVFFLLSAAMAASALVDFDAGRFAKGLGNLGASILMLSVMVQFPFVRAIVKASAQSSSSASPESVRKQREELMKQAEKLRAANPWADQAGRAGWILLAVSLLLRLGGIA